MKKGLDVLIRVVRRRLKNGEALDDILKDYPKLTADDLVIVKAAVEEKA